MGKRFSATVVNMFETRRRVVPTLMIAASILLLSGCAAVDQNVNFLYQPTGLGRDGSGDLYLSQAARSGSGGSMWIIGEIKDKDGNNTGNIVTARPPADTFLDAFTREFKAAGYNVMPVNALPTGVTKGIRLESVEIKLEEVDRVYKVETMCTVKVSLEPWRDGKSVKRLNYENTYSDTTILDRDMILLKSMQTALQELMARVVREVTVILEQK
jgi:uncharacterized lipoprotein YajG